MIRALVTVAGLVAAAGVVFAGWKAAQWLQKPAVAQRRQGLAVPVEVAPVQRTLLRDVRLFTGSLEPGSRFPAAPRVSGRLERLLVNLGDPVERGQLIASLDDQEYVQQVERARAELAVASASVQECRSNLQIAHREFERVQILRDKQIASESEFDQARAQLEVQQARCRLADSQVEQRQAALREAQIRLSYTQIHAGWEGGADIRYIGERFVDEGTLLPSGGAIVSIIDIGNLTAVVHVIERDYARIAVGQAATVTTDAFAGKAFTGRIARIAPQLQETSRQARVEVRVPNESGLLKPGMFVRVELVLAEHPDALAVPAAALVRRDGRQGLFLADADTGKARFVPVRAGIVHGELVEVLEPALSGSVIVMGQHLLEDGSTISIVDEPPPAGSAATARAAQGGRS